MHTKPPGGPFWQLVELFLILPLRLAARWVSLIDALVVAVAGSAARPFTVTGTQVPACTGGQLCRLSAGLPRGFRRFETIPAAFTISCG